jgi:uncharacterized protein (DUF1015 family)
MRLFAFTGTRYADSPTAGRLASPPYDQIDDALRDRLQVEERHFAHLIRPAGRREDAHREAARRHARWLAEGVLVRDPRPALYPYEIRLAGGGRRLGVCALIGLEAPEAGIIRPHEATVEKTVDERLSLLRASQIDLEPILLLAEDEGRLNRVLVEDVEARDALVSHTDAAGHRHRLFRLDEPARIAAYRDLLQPTAGLIADGHHRHTVAQRFAAEVGAASGEAAACKLAVVTSLASPGLQIDPIHRHLRRPVAVANAAALTSLRQSIAGQSAAEIVAAAAAAPQPALVLSAGRDRTEIWGFDPAGAAEAPASHLRHLAVGWLHDAVLGALGLPPRCATDGTLAYRSDPERLFGELTTGEAAIGFWLPPMSPEEFARAIADGRLLPPKSTRFLPKVASGLVWAGHDARLH